MAEYRRDVFCEWEFLKSFNDAQCTPMSEEADLCSDLWKFIKRSHLLLDIERKAFTTKLENDKELFKWIFKSLTTGGGNCECIDEHGFKYVEQITNKGKERFKVVYLLTKDGEICNWYRQKFGSIVLSPKCWEEEKAKANQYLFRDCGSSIEKDKFYSWQEILSSRYNLSNCNAMVLIDNYILKSNLEKLFAKVLDALLPKNLTQEDAFYCTIITVRGNYSVEEKHSEICKIINKLRPDLNYKLEIYVQLVDKTFHDRCILTNNVMIKSGHGFNILDDKGKAKTQTAIQIWHPGIQNASKCSDDEYAAILRRVIDEVVNCTTDGQWEHYPEGPCENRLIIEE